MVGKYVDYADSYKSLNEALIHAGIRTETRVKIRYVDAGQIEEEGAEKILQDVDAILVPGGFGKRGTEGMIKPSSSPVKTRSRSSASASACRWPSSSSPVTCAVSAEQLHRARSRHGPSRRRLITEWKDRTGSVQKRDESSDLGGTMRLGRQEVPVEKVRSPTRSTATSWLNAIVTATEVNNAYVAQFEEKGMVISAKTPTEHLPEMMELPGHPFFFAVQFHPEFTSSPRFGHPLFKAYIEAAIAHADEKKAQA